MQTKHLPRTSGIYQILNTVTGKIYIGSACDLQVRIHKHRRELRLNRHKNAKLQSSWNKHGASVFIASVIEHVADKTKLIEREQAWLDATQVCETGYNIATNAGRGSQLGLIRSEETLRRNSHAKSKPIDGFISPDGKPVCVENMRDHCKAHGLTIACMFMLKSGTATSHKGWTHLNAKIPKREWISTYEGFIDPSGKRLAPITNLGEFCKQHGLDQSSMNKVYQGKAQFCKGWTHVGYVAKTRKPSPLIKTHYGFINPQGEEVVITNLAKFCRDNNLGQSDMYNVLTGKYPQHKGWTFKNSTYQKPPKRKSNVYRGFVDPNGKSVVITDLAAFCKEHGLSRQSMYKLAAGMRSSCRGWTHKGE